MHRFMLAWMLLALLLLGLSVSAQGDTGTQVVGNISASDQEADEGYFALGQETTILAKPGTILHGWLRRHTGERVRVTFEVEPGTE